MIAKKRKGGSKPGERRGGRQRGTPNKASAARVAAAAASGLLPHEFLLAVCRGETFGGYVPNFKDRLTAAIAAAPYYAPKLATVAHTGGDGGPIRHVDLTRLTDAELAALEPVIRAMAAAEDGDGSAAP